jgi:UDP-2,4-diacetamido-2,4,6-trideoxy-beta-L-altropyranose hydrolase
LTWPAVVLRPAGEGDAPLLLEWRNDPEAIRFSVTGLAVAPADHVRWLAARLADPQTRLWIAEEAATAVGQVRVDIADGIGVVSVAIAPDQRGRGLGSAVLGAMVHEIEREDRVSTLRALTHTENVASTRAFERVGFRREGRDGEFLVLERSVISHT